MHGYERIVGLDENVKRRFEKFNSGWLDSQFTTSQLNLFYKTHYMYKYVINQTVHVDSQIQLYTLTTSL